MLFLKKHIVKVAHSRLFPGVCSLWVRGIRHPGGTNLTHTPESADGTIRDRNQAAPAVCGEKVGGWRATHTWEELNHSCVEGGPLFGSTFVGEMVAARDCDFMQVGERREP